MRGAREKRAGVTLLELMLVLMLLALILGSGIGIFSSFDFGKRQAAGLVRNVLRSAQNTAIASSAPSRVRIDKTSGRFHAESMVTVGTYHFENRSIEGCGPAGSAEPEHFDPRGYLGACFRPAGIRKAVAEIPLERDPGFDFARGFSIALALYRETDEGGRVFTLGDADPTVGLDLGKNGALRARFRTRSGELDSQKPGGSVILQSEPGQLAVGRWAIVCMRYDRAHFELLLDDVVLDSQDETSYVWRIDAPLVLSDAALPFPGRIDNLVIGVMVAGEASVLPESVRFSADTPEKIEFVASGGLDRQVHLDPPRIGLEFQDGARETVTVGLYGTVE